MRRRNAISTRRSSRLRRILRTTQLTQIKILRKTVRKRRRKWIGDARRPRRTGSSSR